MIELINLTKKYDNFTAVDNLNLTIETGEFFGLLGPTEQERQQLSAFYLLFFCQQREKY